jgi:hypothetical protein
VQFASEIAVTVYVVVEAGLTVRVAGLLSISVWVNPSDQVTAQGRVPVSAAEIVVEPPGQIVASPLTVAVGSAFTRTFLLQVLEQPVVEFVTVRLRSNEPALPAVTETLCPVVEPTIEPFPEIDQR